VYSEFHLAVNILCVLHIVCVVNMMSCGYTGSQIHYIGIVDASYNTGRPRPDQASFCYYRLRVWSGECVYWDDVIDQWSASGCYLHESSTFHLAQCRYVICFVFYVYLSVLYYNQMHALIGL